MSASELDAYSHRGSPSSEPDSTVAKRRPRPRDDSRASDQSDHGKSSAQRKRRAPKQRVLATKDAPSSALVHSFPITKQERPQEPLQWPEEAFALYKRIAKLQDRFFILQNELDSERDASRSKLGYLSESITGIARLIESTADPDDNGRSVDDWNLACNQFLSDRQSFEEQMKAIDSHGERMSGVTSKLAELMPQLLRMVNSCFYNSGKYDGYESATSSSYSIVSAPPCHPLEQEYYNKHGEVLLLQDRLSNHLAKPRAVLTDGAALRGPSTAAFDSEGGAVMKWWSSEHEKIVNRICVAEKQLADLWDRCKAALLSVEPFQPSFPAIPDTEGLEEPQPQEILDTDLDPRSTQPFVPPDYLGYLPAFLRDFSQPKRTARVERKPDGFSDKRDYIQGWVQEIPTDGGGFGPRFSSSQSDPGWIHVERSPDNFAVNEHSQTQPWPPQPLEIPAGPLETEEPSMLRRLARQIRPVNSDGELHLGWLSRSTAARLAHAHRRSVGNS